MGDLERLWDDLPVGRAPVNDILSAGRRGADRSGRPRRPLRPLLTAGVLTAVGGAFLAGTVVGQPPAEGPGTGTPPGSDVVPAAFHGELQPVEDCAELLDHYVEQGLEIVGPYGWEPYPPHILELGDGVIPRAGAAADAGVRRLNGYAAQAPAPKAQTSTSINSETGTNVQEAGVDEPDAVKTDGEILVRIQGAELTTYDVTGERTRELGSLTLDDFEDGEILLAGDTVVALGHDGTRDRAVPHYYGTEPRATTQVVTVDVGDPAEPAVRERVHYDARLVSARQHGSDVRLVTAAGLPALDFVRPSRGRRGQETALETNRQLVRETTIEDWIPTMSVAGDDPEPVAACEDMAVPRSDLGLDTMNVIGFPADDPADVHTIGLAGSAELAYESADHLYLAASPGGWWTGGCIDFCPRGGRPSAAGTTIVFDFELAGAEASYVGSGEVEGRVADRWAMDEYDGVLRLAVGPTSETGNFNSVITLERRDDELVEIGRVDKLGVNEQIESVRWFDGLAIVVTFRRIDPLYAIDLTDPDDPELMGELKIPGFSEYLHPLGERRLIGIGQGPTGRGGWGAQVGLFDVTDLAAPERIATLSYQRGSRALAGADPRQLTWLPAERTVLTVIEKGRTGWVSVLSLDEGEISNRMVQADYGSDVPEIRTVPLPDGRVVLVTGENVEFFSLVE